MMAFCKALSRFLSRSHAICQSDKIWLGIGFTKKTIRRSKYCKPNSGHNHTTEHHHRHNCQCSKYASSGSKEYCRPRENNNNNDDFIDYYFFTMSPITRAQQSRTCQASGCSDNNESPQHESRNNHKESSHGEEEQ